MQSLTVLIAGGVPLKAQSPWEADLVSALPWLEWLTNSIFVAALVVGLVVVFARSATKRMELVPGAKQNLFEAIELGFLSLFSTVLFVMDSLFWQSMHLQL